ncbi:MAG TPA: hypothetical protein VHL34_14655 [Rhizomicrobium sp.]|jgi:hypothetical protein|nr:hypothetical protein [Rhizomicrobium sp.]
MPDSPNFQSEFLEDVATAFRKRRKTLKHHARIAEFAKVYELVDGEKMERLEIRIGNDSRNAALLRLHAWPDRLIWLGASRSMKVGWLWEWTYEGRLLGEHRGNAIVAALEETFALMYQMNQASVHLLNAPWKPLLGRGPVEVQ